MSSASAYVLRPSVTTLVLVISQEEGKSIYNGSGEGGEDDSGIGRKDVRRVDAVRRKGISPMVRCLEPLL